MRESEPSSENRPNSGSSDVPEKTKEQLSPLDEKIKELRNLEGSIGTLDIDFSMKDSEDQSSIKTHIDQILDRIKQGHEGNLPGKDNSVDIKRALSQGVITEKDLSDRILSIYTDVGNLEDRLKSAKTKDDVSNSVRALVDKYNKDWPA